MSAPGGEKADKAPAVGRYKALSGIAFTNAAGERQYAGPGVEVDVPDADAIGLYEAGAIEPIDAKTKR